MIKAGYNGSGINDVIYMGQVVNQASKLCSKGGKDGKSTIIISEKVYDDLEGKHNGTHYYQNFFNKISFEDNYQGEVVRTDMNNWLNDKKTTNPCYR